MGCPSIEWGNLIGIMSIIIAFFWLLFGGLMWIASRLDDK